MADLTKSPLPSPQLSPFDIDLVDLEIGSMTAMSTSPDAISTPKRKRETDYTAYLSPSPIRVRIETSPRSVEQGIAECGSPRTTVAGQLEALDLTGDDVVRKLEFSGGPQHPGEDHSATPADNQASRLEEMSNTSDIQSSTPSHLISNSWSLKTAVTNSDESSPIPAKAIQQEPLPTPTTPNLKPLPAPLTTFRIRSRSPPPMHLTEDYEITGHNPTDPLDDGYGINGIGFRPTPAMAHARAQRRKQQVAEWKSREAREARQKRSERRRRENSLGKDMGVLEKEGMRRVRFVEGLLE